MLVWSGSCADVDQNQAGVALHLGHEALAWPAAEAHRLAAGESADTGNWTELDPMPIR